MQNKKEITINLSQSISYVPKGGSKKIESQVLIIRCPTQKEMDCVNVIDVAYQKYLRNAQTSLFKTLGFEKLTPYEMTKKMNEYKEASEKNKTEEDKELKFNINDMKANIEPKDLTNCYGALQNILCGSAKLDENTYINSISYKELSLFDLENILQEFIENFIIRSHQP